MGSKSNTWENGLLLLLFNNTNFAGVGDATGLRGSVTTGSLYCSLHTADPTSGNQSTSEASYTDYARRAASRLTTNWIVTGNSVYNSYSNHIQFPRVGSGTFPLITHWALGTSSSGAGKLLYVCALPYAYQTVYGGYPWINYNTVNITED